VFKFDIILLVNFYMSNCSTGPNRQVVKKVPSIGGIGESIPKTALSPSRVAMAF
jgi:hypothetical protein